MALRRGRILLVAFLLLPVALLLTLYLSLPSLSRTGAFREALRRAVLSATGLSLEIDEAEVGYDLSVRGENVRLGSTGEEPLLTAKRLRATVHPKAIAGAPLLRADVEGAHLYLDRLPEPAPRGERQRAVSPENARGSSFRLPPLSFRLRDSFVHHRESAIGPLDLELEAEGGETLALRGRTEVAAPGNEIAWSLTAGGPPITARGEVRGSLADPAAVLRTFAGIEPPAGIAAQVGDLRGSFDVTLPPDGGLQAKLDLLAGGCEAHDADFTRVLQSAQVRTAAVIALDAAGKATGRIDASTQGGELLWDLVYVDLTKHPVGLRIEGDLSKGRARVENVTIEAKNLGNLGGKGSVRLDGGSPKLDLRVSVPDLAPAFDLLLREPLKPSHPSLATTQVAGSAAARFRYESGRPPRIEGKIDLDGGRIAVERPAFRIEGLRIGLPFRIGEASSGKTETGSVEASALAFGKIGIDSVRLDLAAAANRVFLRNPVEVPVLGGSFTLAGFAVEDFAAPERRATAGFSLAGLDLRRLSEEMGWPPFGGTLSGSIPKVTVAEDHAESEGQIEIQVFGGTIRIRNLRLDQLLSPVPEISLDLDFQGLSLKSITKTFGIGHVSGVLNGAFERLVIVRGQPVSFDAWFRTVERRGVKQKVSVKALRQISILGGAGGDAITRGILGLFDEYGYAKMGFRCRLRNDRFEIEGVESRSGKEYLVVGSTLPPRVDVVSHSQIISFSEMLRRLERATQVGGGSTADEG